MDPSKILSRILSSVLEKITGILSIIKGLFSGLISKKTTSSNEKSSWFSQIFDKAKTLLTAVVNNINSLMQNLFSHIPEEKKKPVLIALGGLTVLLILSIIAAFAMSPGKRQEASSEIAKSLTIPPEELFIPLEPDFIPKFILEREPRRYWTLEEIRPYWKALKANERWKEEVKSAVDKLLEGVP